MTTCNAGFAIKEHNFRQSLTVGLTLVYRLTDRSSAGLRLILVHCTLPFVFEKPENAIVCCILRTSTLNYKTGVSIHVQLLFRTQLQTGLRHIKHTYKLNPM